MKIITLPKFSDELVNLPFKKSNLNNTVKYFEIGVQAGFPSPAEDFKEQKLSLDDKYLSNPNATYLIKVVGESMLPTLNPNDILIVKSDKELTDSCIAIISVNNTDFTVKRFDKKNNQLIADNSKYDNIKLNKEDVMLCLGIVKHLVRDL
jgi:DNA polymerase V